ncbi:MAG TPA: excinuclease ABC subunit UvrC [Patescibacteria group bacterium]|nr:excinuclease ABC subunit UvrC [Patescibacteria group bacterium]
MHTLFQPLLKKVRQLPLRPGVYKFYDAKGRLLYIGKATQLRSRVSSYFRKSTNHSQAKQYMVWQIHDVQTIVVDTESEALLLETTLIKKHKPPYNVVMKDDKNFQYIHITNEPFPRIETIRRIDYTKKSGYYFGPYTSGRSVRYMMQLIKTIFRVCTTPPVMKKGVLQFPKRPCLDYQLERCVGPCARVVSSEEYQHIFRYIIQFLQGDYESVQQQLIQEMGKASQTKAYEKAAQLRDQLQAIERLMVEQKVVSTRREHADYLSLVRQGAIAAVNVFMVRVGKMIHQQVFFLSHTEQQTDQEIMTAFIDQYYVQSVTKPPKIFTNTSTHRGKHRKLLAMGEMNAKEALQRQTIQQEQREQGTKRGLQELSQALHVSLRQLHRIEVYDISNVQGKYAVGSMVVFIDGVADHSEYRKFKIKTVSGANDFASLQEVLDRRLHHLPEKTKRATQIWPTPSLLIIDGGKGQLHAAKTVLDILHVEIPIIALAKREEEIFIPHQAEPVLLPRGSAGLHLIQRMRDEAHRFAITFYRKRHVRGIVSK